MGADLARAEDGPDYGRSGFYLGLGGFYAFEHFDLTTTDLGVVGLGYTPGTDPQFDNSAGADLRLGYRVAPHLAFEFDYQFHEGYDSTLPTGAGFPFPLELDMHLFSLNAKIPLLTGCIQPYGLLGAAMMIRNTEVVDAPGVPKPFDEDLGYATRFGGGIDFYASENWVFYVESVFVLPVGIVDDSNLTTLGGGVQYRF
jgi:hypothetical protein